MSAQASITDPRKRCVYVIPVSLVSSVPHTALSRAEAEGRDQGEHGNHVDLQSYHCA
jgi:hypothetical protein